ncbi:MAG TPA: CDP-glycerol glycerophosphotransferase family protein [Aeromicrobium sp.]|nr:CDP-glycerol glycerophosphotransferase family protein [Aeromicrobium sp.]
MRVRDFVKRWRRRVDPAALAATPTGLIKRARQVHRLDAEGWTALVADATRATAGWGRNQWLELAALDRVVLHLAANGDRLGAERVAENRTVHGTTFGIDRDLRRIDLGLELDLPDWLLAAQPQDFVARTLIEAAGVSPVVVAGTSFISGVSFAADVDQVSVWLVGPAGESEVPVTMRPDPAADAETGERWADQTQASWWTRLDLDRSTEVKLKIVVTFGEISRTVEVKIPARPQTGFEVSVTPGEDGLVLAGSVGQVAVATSTQAWAEGELPLRLGARVAQFGAETVVPTGRYGVLAEPGLDLADPTQLIRPLAERAIELDGVLVTLRGWSPQEPEVSLVVRNPITVAERGRRGQRLLLQEIRDAAGPLRERAVAMCFGGRRAGDSVYPVVRELLARGIPVDVCVSDYSVPVPEGAQPVLLHSRAWHEAFTHAKYLVNNAEFPHYVRFREGQRYLQAWHGTPLKRIANDIVKPQLSAGYTAAMGREVQAWEALLAQNEFAAVVLPKAFGFERRTIVEGYPRNDALVADPGLRERTRVALGLGNELVVLYAPTWRDSARDADGRRAFVSHLDTSRLHAELGATVLVRSHSNTAAARGSIKADGVVDVTAHPDITALMAAADVLVTDYSSVMFDFAVTERPQVFLVPDVEQYRDVDRGFYLDLDQIAPGPLVTTTDELIEALRDPGAGYAAPRSAFRHEFAPKDDGHAARRVVDAWLGPATH